MPLPLAGLIAFALCLVTRDSLAAVPDTSATLRRAISAQSAGRLDEARHLFDLAVAADPTRPDAWRRRANLRAEREDWKGAIEDLRRAVQVAPGFAEAWSALGFYLLLSGDFPGALGACFGNPRKRSTPTVERDQREG